MALLAPLHRGSYTTRQRDDRSCAAHVVQSNEIRQR